MAIEASVTPDWRDLLLKEVAADPRGKAGVAQRMGVSRAYVSRALSAGKSGYRAVPERFIRRVFDLATQVDCPYSGSRRPRADCFAAAGPIPTWNPLLVAQWRACQQCPLKPLTQQGAR